MGEVTAAETSPRLRQWQSRTLALLVVGYAGYYLCRSNFSVALPLIIEELTQDGMPPDVAKTRLGSIASLGVLAYAMGKFLSGGLTDFLGGRRNFLLGMLGSVGCTIAFALAGGLPLFTLAWIGNRLVQSTGWVGIVKITSRWFAASQYGTAMGIVSLSYLFGDAISRAFMGWLIHMGMGWRGVFLVAALVLLLLFLLTAVFLKESPVAVGEDEPHTSGHTLFGAAGEQVAPTDIWTLLQPFVHSRVFWAVCGLSLGFTLLRETFNTWMPTYFTEVVGLSGEAAASSSAIFPLLGGISVLVAGYLSDRIGRPGRAIIICTGLLTTTIGLFSLGVVGGYWPAAWVVVLVGALGFVMIGPYSYLGGAVALDFGGKQGSATACGIIDGVGYLGGVLAGDTVARVSVAFGWSGAFFFLGVVAALSAWPAVMLLQAERRFASMSVSV